MTLVEAITNLTNIVTQMAQAQQPADMTVDNASVATGQTVNITAWKKVAPH